ncbi:hypothetical protein M501DRAFT_994654 [Patellaria atrata CBS 101060]|uniref:Uncharacterized protein n=1 Tax=Patellaria atrata CBS 101060 TaxID=1346257 RepID=A0A9P4SJV6_9PEZI|nr:hypothetical protein M501DRAFT_994654 [Patellaria atrata CBS 101060]
MSGTIPTASSTTSETWSHIRSISNHTHSLSTKSSTMPSQQSPPLSLPRALRYLTLYAFPPGFILAFLHGIIAGQAVPALGIIPLVFSALIAMYLLHRNQISYGGSPIQLSPLNILVLDFVLVILYLVLLIISWIVLTEFYRDNGQIILGTYATVPQMLCCGVHVWFVLVDVGRMVKHSRECEDCAGAGHASGEYEPLKNGDRDAEEELEEARLPV